VLDATELNQIAGVLRREMFDMMSAATQRPGSYRYLVEVRGVLMFSHHPIGCVWRDYG